MNPIDASNAFAPRYQETLILDDPVEIPVSGLVAMAEARWKHGHVTTDIEHGHPLVHVSISFQRPEFIKFNVMSPATTFNMQAERKPESDLLVIREVLIGQPKPFTEEDRKRNEEILDGAFKAMWRMS